MKNEQSVLNYIKIFDDYNKYFNEVSDDEYIDKADDCIAFSANELVTIRASPLEEGQYLKHRVGYQQKTCIL